MLDNTAGNSYVAVQCLGHRDTLSQGHVRVYNICFKEPLCLLQVLALSLPISSYIVLKPSKDVLGVLGISMHPHLSETSIIPRETAAG